MTGAKLRVPEDGALKIARSSAAVAVQLLVATVRSVSCLKKFDRRLKKYHISLKVMCGVSKIVMIGMFK